MAAPTREKKKELMDKGDLICLYKERRRGSMIIGSLGTPLKALDSLYTPHLINCFHEDFHFLKVYLIGVMNMKVEQKVGRKLRGGGIRRKSGFEGFLNFLLMWMKY